MPLVEVECRAADCVHNLKGMCNTSLIQVDEKAVCKTYQPRGGPPSPPTGGPELEPTPPNPAQDIMNLIGMM